MVNQFEQRNISFRKNTRKETTVEIVSETPINYGSFGKIFDTVIEIGGHRKRFITKKYWDIPPKEDAKKRAKIAFENYSLAKNAGLKVFPTFRIAEDGKSILMTTGFSDNQICVGSNNFDQGVINFKQPPIEEIIDADKFLANFFAEGLKAAQKGIGFCCDLFFFVLSKDKPTKIDFILGDLDNLEKAKLTKRAGERNMKQIRDALVEFCEVNMEPGFAKNFLDKVEHYYQQGAESVVNSSELK